MEEETTVEMMDDSAAKGSEDMAGGSKALPPELDLDNAPHGGRDWRDSAELPRRKSQDDPQGYFPERIAAPSLIVIHHTGTDDGIQDVNKYHLERNWNPGRQPAVAAPHIAYHYYIDPEGRVTACNYIWERVWHAARANDVSIGVALQGDFQRAEPSPAQLESLDWLIGLLLDTYDLPPASVVGHGDLTSFGNSTGCPGRHLRARVAALGDAAAEDEAIAPAG